MSAAAGPLRRDIHPCLAAQPAGIDPTEVRCVNLWWHRRVARPSRLANAVVVTRLASASGRSQVLVGAVGA